MGKTATLDLRRHDVVFFHFPLSRPFDLVHADGFGGSVSLVTTLRAAGRHHGGGDYMWVWRWTRETPAVALADHWRERSRWGRRGIHDAATTSIAG